jgi:hypothetical protein
VTIASNALALTPSDYVNVGVGAWAFLVGDWPGGTSAGCLAANWLCVSGTTGPSSPVTWGAGWGISIAGASMANPYTPSSSGLTYSLSNIPSQGLEFDLFMAVSPSGPGPNFTYQLAPGGTTSGTIPWTSFSSPSTAQHLTGPPALTGVNVQVPTIATAAPFDFCVTGFSL